MRLMASIGFAPLLLALGLGRILLRLVEAARLVPLLLGTSLGEDKADSSIPGGLILARPVELEDASLVSCMHLLVPRS